MKKLLIVVAMAFSASACATAHMEKAQPVNERNCGHVQRLYDKMGPQALTPVDGDLLDRCHEWGYQSSASEEKPRPMKLKPIHVRGAGVDFKRGRDGIAYINGHAAAHDEATPEADAYSSGLITVIVYASGKVNAIEDGGPVKHLH